MNRVHFRPISRHGPRTGPAHAAAGPRRYNAAMHDIPSRIADDLLEIEATLRRHGRRGRVRPPARSGIFDCCRAVPAQERSADRCAAGVYPALR